LADKRSTPQPVVDGRRPPWVAVTLDGSAQAAESRPSLRRRLWRKLMAWAFCRWGHHGREDGQGRCRDCGREVER
jgi:hypothetical protein